MVGFNFSEMFDLGDDATEYRLLSKAYTSLASFNGQDVLLESAVPVYSFVFKQMQYGYGISLEPGTTEYREFSSSA